PTLPRSPGAAGVAPGRPPPGGRPAAACSSSPRPPCGKKPSAGCARSAGRASSPDGSASTAGNPGAAGEPGRPGTSTRGSDGPDQGQGPSPLSSRRVVGGDRQRASLWSVGRPPATAPGDDPQAHHGGDAQRTAEQG